MAAASSSPLSVNRRTDSPSPLTTSSDGCLHISPHIVKKPAAARVCFVMGCFLSSSSSIHSRTSLKKPEIHQ